jgi:hypothetical protein
MVDGAGRASKKGTKKAPENIFRGFFNFSYL